MTLHVAIGDDESPARRRLRALLAPDREIAIAGECKTGREIGELIARCPLDIVFLDIEMPESDGLSVIEQIPAPRRPHVVLVTAHEQYAIRAFDVRVVDYVLKPYRDERFAVALERAKAAARSPICSPRLAVRDRATTTFIELGAIDWVESADNYVQLHTGGACHLLRKTLAELELQLPAADFARTHRRAIVNLHRVRELRRDRLVLANGIAIPLGRRYRAAIARRLAR